MLIDVTVGVTCNDVLLFHVMSNFPEGMNTVGLFELS